MLTAFACLLGLIWGIYKLIKSFKVSTEPTNITYICDNCGYNFRGKKAICIIDNYNLITFCISINPYPKLSNSSGEGYSFITSLSG